MASDCGILEISIHGVQPVTITRDILVLSVTDK